MYDDIDEMVIGITCRHILSNPELREQVGEECEPKNHENKLKIETMSQ